MIVGKNASLSGEWMASGAAAAGAAASVVIFTVLRLLRNVKMSYKSIDKRIYRW